MDTPRDIWPDLPSAMDKTIVVKEPFGWKACSFVWKIRLALETSMETT